MNIVYKLVDQNVVLIKKISTTKAFKLEIRHEICMNSMNCYNPCIKVKWVCISYIPNQFIPQTQFLPLLLNKTTNTTILVKYKLIMFCYRSFVWSKKILVVTTYIKTICLY